MYALKLEKTGLVLEGGGFRGTYTAGVLDAFIDYQIRFPYVIGVSAGVCNAVSYFSKQKGRSASINIEHCKDKDYYSVRNLIKTGSIFSEKMLFDIMPHQLYPFDYQTYRCEYTKLVAVVTNCVTGKPEYYELDDLQNQYTIVKASCWLPFVSEIVEYDGKKMLDGGIADSIPVTRAMADGCEKLVIVLTRPKEYRKQPSSATKLASVVYRKYPNLIEALIARHQEYNATLDLIEKLEMQGKAFVIRPSESLDIGRLEKDPQKLRYAQKLGYQDAINCLTNYIEF